MGRQELIRQRAHAIWESEGRPENRSEEHWRMASAEIEEAEAEAEAASEQPQTEADAKPSATQSRAKAAKEASGSGSAVDQKPAANGSQPQKVGRAKTQKTGTASQLDGELSDAMSGADALVKSAAKRGTKRAARN